MVIDVLKNILDELARQELFPAAVLRPNQAGICAIPLPDGAQLRLELDKRAENLLILSVLGNVTPGRYRENLFKEALKANGLPHPRHGTLAFSTHSEKLLLFESMPLPGLTGGEVGAFLQPFMEKASVWREAVSTGSVPEVAASKVNLGLGSLFGLRSLDKNLPKT